MAARGFGAAMLALAFALPAAACSEGQVPPGPVATVPLPTAADLPDGHNQSCACVRDGQCVVLEEIPGAFEVRNLDCRWLRPNAVAQCAFDQRFVAYRFEEDGSITEDPGEWGRRTLRAVRLPNGGWCAE